MGDRRWLEQHQRWKRNLKKKVFQAYGNACSCCGESMEEFLTIHHVLNDGKAHKAKVGNRTFQVYGDIKKQGYPRHFQLLCMNCNWAKGMYGYCPHRRS